MRTVIEHTFHENTAAVSEGRPMSSGTIIGVSTLMLEVTGNAAGLELRIYGAVRLRGEQYTPVAVIDMSDFSKLTVIEENGIYAVPVDGLSSVKASVEKLTSGAVSVYGKAGE